ncbi:MAG: glycosyltransferase family 4 protein [Candidatus Eremiobacteraeota bacterium]|nr:glycosyltransferase family 4 protein [Candidatus Eremiobacteraeota bacterium]
MRILILNWRDPKHPQAGGAETYLFEQARRWVLWGHHVQWLTANFSGGRKHEVMEAIPIRRSGNWLTAYFMLPWVYVREFRGRFDILIDSSNGIPFFTPLFARTPKVCIVHHVHREIFRKHLSPWLAYPLMWCETKLVPFLYRKARFVTVSEDTRNEMLRLHIGTPPIGLVRNGVDPALRPGTKAAVPTVLYLGRLKAYKRVDLLIDAFARVRRRVSNAMMRVAGSGDSMRGLVEQVKRLGLTGCVVFEGFVDENRKLELLQGAWVSVVPSETEGWGITVIESNACGTPAIAFAVPGLREAIVDGVSGLLVPDGEDLARPIERVLTDSELRQKLAEGAVARAQAFSWDASAAQMLGYLSNLASSKTFEGWPTAQMERR